MEACTDKSKVGLLLLRSMYGCRDAGVNWEIAICQVMTAIGFVQVRTSPCIYRHLEKQLRVWVEGKDCVSLFTSPMLSGSLRNCKSCGSSRIEESLDPPDIMTVCKAFVCWVELWNGNGSSTCRTDGEIVRSDWSVSLDTWSQRQA